MNVQLSSCPCFLVHICPLSVLCLVLQLPAPVPSSSLAVVDAAPTPPTVIGCCCSSSRVQISNQYSASALCCVLSWMFVSSCFWSIWLICLPLQWLWCQHWLAFALTNHAPPNPSPHPHLSKSWLTVAMTTSCCPALPLPACAAWGTLPCPCPVPIGDCPPVRCLCLTVLLGMV